MIGRLAGELSLNEVAGVSEKEETRERETITQAELVRDTDSRRAAGKN